MTYLFRIVTQEATFTNQINYKVIRLRQNRSKGKERPKSEFRIILGSRSAPEKVLGIDEITKTRSKWSRFSYDRYYF